MSTLIHPSIPCTCTSVIKPNMDFLTKATICCTHFFPFLLMIHSFFMFVIKNHKYMLKKKTLSVLSYTHMCVLCNKISYKKVKIACIYKLTAWRKDNHYNNILLEDFYSSEHVRSTHSYDVFCPITSSTTTLMPSFFMLLQVFALGMEASSKLFVHVKKRKEQRHTHIYKYL